jgi:hypothetical protein
LEVLTEHLEVREEDRECPETTVLQGVCDLLTELKLPATNARVEDRDSLVVRIRRAEARSLQSGGTLVSIICTLRGFHGLAPVNFFDSHDMNVTRVHCSGARSFQSRSNGTSFSRWIFAVFGVLLRSRKAR